MRSLYANFCRLKREIGPVNAVLAVGNRLLRRLHPRLGLVRYYLVAQPVPADTGARRPGGRIRIRPLPPGDPALAGQDRPAQEIHNRFDSGGICLAAFPEGSEQALGFIWLIWGPYTEPRHRCRLIPPDDRRSVLDVDIYIQQHARGGMTFMRLWEGANDCLRRHGVERTYSRISAFNGASLRAHRRMGAQAVASQVFVELGAVEVLIHRQWPFIIPITGRSRAPDVRLPGLHER